MADSRKRRAVYAQGIHCDQQDRKAVCEWRQPGSAPAGRVQVRRFGLRLKDGAHGLTQLVDQFLLRPRCTPWDEAAATHFASVAADMHKAGTPIGSMDAINVGHAAAHTSLDKTAASHRRAFVASFRFKRAESLWESQ